MNNPLNDAESLIYDKDFNIIELGKKAKFYSEINGQFMGLIKIRADIAKQIFQIWSKMDTNKIYDGKDYNNMYMTSFLQLLIDKGYKIQAAMINNGLPD